MQLQRYRQCPKSSSGEYSYLAAVSNVVVETAEDVRLMFIRVLALYLMAA